MCQGEHWCARAQGVPAVPTPIRGWMGGKLWLSVPPGVLEVWAGQGADPNGLVFQLLWVLWSSEQRQAAGPAGAPCTGHGGLDQLRWAAPQRVASLSPLSCLRSLCLPALHPL